MSFPKLRFKQDNGQEFPAWVNEKLGTIGPVLMCKRILKEQTKPVGDVPFYKIGTFGKQPDAYISDEIYKSFRERYSFPKKGEILISAAGTIGRTVVYDGLPAYFQDSNIVWIANNEKVLKNSFLNFLYAKTSWNTENTTIARLYNDNLKSILISYPSIPEQNKIANFLTAVDEKISQLTQKTDLLAQYKKGVMRQIFSQELRFKDDDGSEFPEWEETTLGEIGKFKSGTGFPDSEQGGTSGVPFYKVSDMNLAENKLEMLLANNYVSEDQINKLKFNVINDDAIVFAKVGAAIFLERKRKAKKFLIDNNMMAFIPTCDINFIKHFMDSIRLSKFAQVGALPSYNASDLSIIEIAVPVIKEQTKIASFLTAIDDKIIQTQAELDAVKQYKQGLLQQMFV